MCLHLCTQANRYRSTSIRCMRIAKSVKKKLVENEEERRNNDEIMVQTPSKTPCNEHESHAFNAKSEKETGAEWSTRPAERGREYCLEIFRNEKVSYSREIFKCRKVLQTAMTQDYGRNEMAMFQVNNKWENNICIIYLGGSKRARTSETNPKYTRRARQTQRTTVRTNEWKK